jgi:hypothetical protein
VLSSSVWAWGGEGHETIARIAEARLSDHAKSRVHELLALEGKSSLAQVASWADEQKAKKRNTLSHAVRIPFDASEYDEKRDCSGRGKCVVFGIQRAGRTLANNKASASDQLKALKYLVHFVGDVHQPLHSIMETGGFPVQIQQHKFLMHKVWDTIGVRELKKTPELLAEELGGTTGDVKQLDPEAWALESHAIARDFIYHGDKNFANSKNLQHLPDDYLDTMAPIIKARMTAGGVRLGNVLNTVLSSP